MLGKILSGAVIAACLALPALAQSTVRPVIFAAGSTGTAVTGRITGHDTADFTLLAEAGQHMTIRMNTDSSSAYFNIYAPGTTPETAAAIFTGSSQGLLAELTLPASGTYLIRAYQMASAAAENRTAQFALTIDIAGRRAQSGDVAGALNSEPDF
ncbi:MAG: hypothetical protein Q4G26_14355, partial [Paracoccus sp. (in: a-proteobacteria)]|nr:hypothetical protein [Paracoccus sp. (in: a-proteobacteria)]